MEPEYRYRLGLTNAMTPCNRLVFDRGVPMRTYKINLAEIFLQVETLAPSLNLQDDDFIVFLLAQQTKP
jgi:hypothetical protein